MLQEIKLVNFRNFSTGNLILSGRDVVLSGPNGSGKSNLLEAIHHLSLLRSFRGARSREEIKIGESEFFLSGKLRKNGVSEILSVREKSDGRRELFIGETRLRKSSEFIGEFQTVPFVPEDRMIAGGHSGYRRKFFDILLSALDKKYFFALSRYHRALDQRNRALKENKLSVAAAFEEELSECGVEIGNCRAFYCKKIVAEMNELFSGKYHFEAKYLRAFPEEKEKYLEKLKESRPREALKKCTLFGPQLDEFEFRLDGKLLRGYCSAGQQRLTSLLLRLTHFRLLRNETPRIPVIALIDDVTGELDRENINRFLENISAADQRIFTFTDVPRHEFFDAAVVIPVKEIV
ncbi:MAG: DNA replication and repair protein RecF [Victivallaceae bacterium]|nr:DNA replication and repair protein RecF [Victivallaceae bacterium]